LSAELTGVYSSVHDLRLGFWYLDLEAQGSDKCAFNLHFCALWRNTHAGVHTKDHGTAPQIYDRFLLVGQEFPNFWGLNSRKWE
jgi:hypothetical protein